MNTNQVQYAIKPLVNELYFRYLTKTFNGYLAGTQHGGRS